MKGIRRIPVRLGPRRYEVRIGAGHLSRFGALLRRMDLGETPVVLTNAAILRQHGAGIRQSLAAAGFPWQPLTIPDMEQSKSLPILSRLLRRLARLDGPGRRLFLVLAGGGVVGDLGALAAGLYRRGVPFVQLPTTLLAQVDSGIGGKSGVDLPEGKNLVGLIVQPRLVFVELDFVRTLPDRQFRSGLAEVAKCAVIRDARLFSFLERCQVRALRRQPDQLAWVVARAAAVKATVVEEDEREERGIRTILNFGHTLGHAVETATGYGRAYTHGEAVGLGMLAATRISRWMGLISPSAAGRIHRLIARLGLPVALRGVSLRRILTAMRHDKKWIRRSNRWVLPTGIGRCRVQDGVPDGAVQAALRELAGGQG